MPIQRLARCGIDLHINRRLVPAKIMLFWSVIPSCPGRV